MDIHKGRVFVSQQHVDALVSILRILDQHWRLEQAEEGVAMVPSLEPVVTKLYRLILCTVFDASIFDNGRLTSRFIQMRAFSLRSNKVWTDSAKRIEDLHRLIMARFEAEESYRARGFMSELTELRQRMAQLEKENTELRATVVELKRERTAS